MFAKGVAHLKTAQGKSARPQIDAEFCRVINPPKTSPSRS